MKKINWVDDPWRNYPDNNVNCLLMNMRNNWAYPSTSKEQQVYNKCGMVVGAHIREKEDSTLLGILRTLEKTYEEH